MGRRLLVPAVLGFSLVFTACVSPSRDPVDAGGTGGDGGRGGDAGAGGDGGRGGDAGAGGAIGCSSEPACSSPDGCICGGECVGGTLQDYCAGPCRSFEEALAAANALEEAEGPYCDDGILWRSFSGVGTCGDFRWVMLRPSLDSRFELFDPSGAMVAAEYWTDCNCFCNSTSFSKSYGPVPGCERIQTEEPCEVMPVGP